MELIKIRVVYVSGESAGNIFLPAVPRVDDCFKLSTVRLRLFKVMKVTWYPIPEESHAVLAAMSPANRSKQGPCVEIHIAEWPG